MKAKANSSNLAVIGAVVVALIAGAFWVLLLSPKRDEIGKLDESAQQLKSSLAQHRAEISEAESARRQFPVDYQHLVVLGKAVPGGDETASLLVQMNRIADSAGGTFHDIKLSASGGGEPASAAPAAGSAEEPAPPTEVAASLLPLGATVGDAGLAVMPYNVTFEGNFFDVANFINGLDKLVKTNREEVAVDGRLVTIDGFSLVSAPDTGFPKLTASFALTTYLTPPGEGSLSAGSPESAATPEANPTAETIGAAR